MQKTSRIQTFFSDPESNPIFLLAFPTNHHGLSSSSPPTYFHREKLFRSLRGKRCVCRAINCGVVWRCWEKPGSESRLLRFCLRLHMPGWNELISSVWNSQKSCWIKSAIHTLSWQQHYFWKVLPAPVVYCRFLSLHTVFFFLLSATLPFPFLRSRYLLRTTNGRKK